MSTQPQPRIEELDHEALWDSCINLAARLPMRVNSIDFVATHMRDDMGDNVLVMKPSAEVYWAGGPKTDFMEFEAHGPLSSPRLRPTKTTPLERDILQAMGKPKVERHKLSRTVTDFSPSASRHPELAHQVAVACLKRAVHLDVVWLTDDAGYYYGDPTGSHFARVDHPSRFAEIKDEAIWAGVWLKNMEDLLEIRRRLAPLVGEAVLPYETDYAVFKAACDRIAPRAESWPHQREIPMTIAGLRSPDWIELS